MDTGIPGDPVHTGTYSDPEVQERILRELYSRSKWTTTAARTSTPATTWAAGRPPRF